MIKPCTILLSTLTLFAVSSCTASTSSITPKDYLATVPIGLQVKPFSAEEKVMLDDATAIGTSFLGQGVEDTVFSPVSYALAKGMEERKYEPVASITQKANLKTEDTAISSCSAIASLHDLDEEDAQKYAEAYVSVFVDSSIESLSQRLSTYLEKEISLPSPLDVAYINCLRLEDSFYNPLLPTRHIFEEKGEIPFASSPARYCSFKRTEKWTLLRFALAATELSLLWPMDGFSLNDIDPSLLYASDLEKDFASILVPEFAVTGTYFQSSAPGERFMQTAEFSFDRYGVYGDATSISAPTSSQNPPELSFVVDRPFYFCSSLEGAALYIGSFGK